MSEEPKFFDGYSLQEIHEWYMDLAKEIDQIVGGNSTAVKLLQYYLNPKEQVQNKGILKRCREDIAHQKKEDGTDNFFGSSVNNQAGTFILDDAYLRKVMEVTNYHSVMKQIKSIFLSKANPEKGIIAHMKKGIKNKYSLYYYDGVKLEKDVKDVLLSTAGMMNFKMRLSENQKKKVDVYVGLNTFAVRADVVIKINSINLESALRSQTDNSVPIKSINVSITSWKSTFFDYYDFDPKLGIPLLNPHYKKGKIHPEKEHIDIKELQHDKLVDMTTENPPLANRFYVFKEYTETNPDLLVENQEITWR